MFVALFFWPAIVVGIFLSASGIVLHRPAWLITAAVLSLPFSLYLAATPRFRIVGLFPAVFLFGAALATHRRREWVSWLLLAPVAVFFGWFAVIVAIE